MTSVRLALGLFTNIPAGNVGDVDRSRARDAMLWAPLIGVLLGSLAAAVVWAVHALVPTALGALLAAIAGIGLLVWLTRALHLDGLADTADALGSGKPAEQALEIARRGDVGPFGVVALVLALLVQVTALAVAVDAGVGAVALVLAVVAGRVAVVLACMRGIPAARPEGLGALVAGTVPRAAAIAWALALIAAAAGAGVWLDSTAWPAVLAVIMGLAAAMALVSRAVRRLGGITGDVLGGAAEIATTAVLLVAALAYANSLTW